MAIEWGVAYNNGDGLLQYNEDGTENKYTDIDRTHLIKFYLFERGVHDRVNQKLSINLSGNKKLIYRHRVAMNLTKNTREEVIIAGWQENIEGRNVQMLSFIFEDGHIEIADHFSENHPWFYPIRLLPDECI